MFVSLDFVSAIPLAMPGPVMAVAVASAAVHSNKKTVIY
jgi:hypothetical protein